MPVSTHDNIIEMRTGHHLPSVTLYRSTRSISVPSDALATAYFYWDIKHKNDDVAVLQYNSMTSAKLFILCHRMELRFLTKFSNAIFSFLKTFFKHFLKKISILLVNRRIIGFIRFNDNVIVQCLLLSCSAAHCSALPCHCSALQCHCSALPCHCCATLPCHCSAALPCHCLALPCHCSALPCHCSALPCHCLALPCYCSVLPCHCSAAVPCHCSATLRCHSSAALTCH